ncbi:MULTISPECIES: acyltransferase family protein [Winogradskyella]|uniref:Acyltransferase 3 domain-containing protein n=1 Tax=Winogradskyella damuponensis TaxID=943939 RepID=A0ABP8CXZ3_9FLAO
MKPSIELIRLIAVILIVFTHTKNELEYGIAYVIVEQIPPYGTAILSIISGYLYFEVSRHKQNLFFKKIKSLLIPYLIANMVVLILVLFVYYILGYNPLNRLSFDLSLITEGLFSLNSAPINPPTYFIRDIFVIFSIIALVTQKEFKTLFVILPFLLLGTLILRLDVAFLFLIGVLYSKYHNKIDKKTLIITSVILSVILGFFYVDFLKFPIAFLIFILLIDIQIKFYNTGRFSYLLHLYHSPIIVISYPILTTFIEDPILKIVAQIAMALLLVYVFFLVTKKYDFLKILSGGR